MKVTSYLINLILGSIGLYLIINTPLNFVASLIHNQPRLIAILISIPIIIIQFLPFIFIFVRICICIQYKKILLPEKYQGFVYILGLIVTIPLLTIVGYYLYAIAGGNAAGLSGIPLFMVATGVALLSLPVMLICEIPAFKAFRNNAT